MAINLAEKFSSKVDERFILSSITNVAVNQDYDWVGVDTVKVYSIPTVALGDYNRSGSNRYGVPSELQDNVQEMKMTQDKSFTFTIDKGNEIEQMGAKNAGVALRRQVDEVVIPTVDQYRLTTMAAAAGTVKASEVIDKTNAYEAVLTGFTTLSDKKVPIAGRLLYITSNMYKFLKLDPAFVKNSDIGQSMVLNGQLGQVEGMPVILAPTGYLPTNTNFIITHSIATVAPNKLAEYKIHENPPGISGNLVEGRIIFDSFVLENKKNAIYMSKSVA